MRVETEVEHLLFPVPEIAQGARAVGHVMGKADTDGVYRRITPLCRFDDVDVPALGWAAWQATQEGNVPVTLADGQLQLGNHIVPLDGQGRAILRFKGTKGSLVAVDGVYQATTTAVKAAIYRQRYDIYVDEMDQYHSIADHENRWLKTRHHDC